MRINFRLVKINFRPYNKVSKRLCARVFFNFENFLYINCTNCNYVRVFKSGSVFISQRHISSTVKQDKESSMKNEPP